MIYSFQKGAHMYTLLKQHDVREQMLAREIKTFTPDLFAEIFKLDNNALKHYLKTQTNNGFIKQLKRGLYTLESDRPSEEEIANSLYKPSYISFEYALSYHGVLPEMPYVITSATTKPTRIFDIDSTPYLYKSIKPEAYTGYSLIKNHDREFLMADVEKALVDYLYFVSLRKCPFNERLPEYSRNVIDHEKFLSYCQLYKNSKLNEFKKIFI